MGTTRPSAAGNALVGEWTKNEAFNAEGSESGPISEAGLENDSADFARAASYGQTLLKAGDIVGYVKHLEQEIVPRGKITATVLEHQIVRVRV